MPEFGYLLSLARRYQVKVAKMDKGKYRIAGEDHRIVLMVVDEQGEVWYGTYGVPPFLHPVTRKRIPPTCYAQGNFGIRAGSLDEPFEAASNMNHIHNRPFPELSTHHKSIVKDEAYRDQSGRCYYCDKYLEYTQATLDHLTPLARGGADAPFNIVVACLACNQDKAEKTLEEYQQYLSRQVVK